MSKKIIFIIFLSLFGINSAIAAPVVGNVGIIKSGIWYSKDPFYAGDKVRVYTLIFNGSQYDLLGEAVFDDNNKVLCTGSFTAGAGRTQEVWCDFTASLGTHKISAKIINPKIAPVGEAPQVIVLENNISGISERLVSAPPKKTEQAFDDTTKASSSLSTSTPSAIEKGLEFFRGTVLQVLPEKITSEDVVDGGEQIASATPKTIRDGVVKIIDSVGADKLKTPIMLIVDFFVMIYNFLMSHPVALVIFASLILLGIAKYVYGRLV